jgi:diguanylate cyclase (GGDEF)-like protein/PAS domain S-box-containing protein
MSVISRFSSESVVVDNGRVRARVRHRYLCSGLLAVAVYPLLPESTFKDSVFFNLVGTSAVVAIGVGVYRSGPATRLAWFLLAVGQALFVAGDTAFSVYQHVLESAPFPSPADGLYLSGYPLLAVGLLLLLRGRTPGQDWAGLLDAAVVTAGLGTLSWVFLMAPYVHDPSLSLAALLISLAYPLADILLLAMALRLLFSPRVRTPSLLLLGLSLVSLLLSDTVYGAFNLTGAYHPGSILDMGWMLSYVLFGAAALDPSMPRMAQRAGTVEQRFARWRLALLGGAMAAVPAAVVIQEARGAPLDPPVFAAAGLVLIVLVLTRLAGVIGRHERAISRESVLRQAGLALVEARDRETIGRVATRFALSLVGERPGVRSTLALGSPDRFAVVAAGGEQAAAFEGLILPAFPEQLRLALAAGSSTQVPRELREEIGLDGEGAVVVAPILLGDELSGVLGLRFEQSLSPELRDGLEALAAQVALALESAALGEQVHRQRSEERFRSLVQNSSDLITIVDPDLTIRYQTPSVEPVLGYRPGELAGRKLDTLAHEDDRSRLRAFLADASRSAGSTAKREFRLLGIDGGYRALDIVASNLLHDASVGGIVLTAHDVTAQKALEQELAHRALHDRLTGLANRELFADRLRHALLRRRQQPIAVLFLDLDDFKTVNDSLGHSAGDELLAQLAGRLRSTARAGDTVARLGGDEFALLLDDLASAAEAGQFAERLLTMLAAPMAISGKELICSASIGIAVSEPGAAQADQLLQAADVAMYEAKRHGKDRYAIFESTMQESVMERLELKSELRRALEGRQLLLHYQPIILLRTGQIVGLEALVRWRHPTRGLVPPAEFIPIAEETGLIVPFGRWVLDETCQQLRAWHLRHPAQPPLWASVNLSVRQLQSPSLLDDVRLALAKSGLQPTDLVLEITESVLMDDIEQMAAQLRALKESGVRLAIDDFGTGYSALGYLRRLPVDMLKIDKQFVDDIDSDSEQARLAAAVVRLGRTLQLQVIAEGIEQSPQSERLRELRCTLGQGFHYSPPLSPEGIETLLAKQGRARTAVA